MKIQKKIAVAVSAFLIVGTIAVIKIMSSANGFKKEAVRSSKKNTHLTTNYVVGQPKRYYDMCEKLAKLSIHKNVETVLGSGR